MGAYNNLMLTDRYPRCGMVAELTLQLHAAASFESDDNGRFHDRSYRLGDQLEWWPESDPRFDSWHEDPAVSDRGDGTFEEAVFGDCSICNMAVVGATVYRGLRIQAVRSIVADQ
jgi:hypothetical protein